MSKAKRNFFLIIIGVVFLLLGGTIYELVEAPKAFEGNYYKLYDNEHHTFDSASRFCEEQGGHLVTISTEEENEFVRSLFAHKKGAEQDTQIWLDSLYDRNEKTIIWDTGEPSEVQKADNTYSTKYVRMNNDGSWSNATNTNDRFPFVCEWEEYERGQVFLNFWIVVGIMIATIIIVFGLINYFAAVGDEFGYYSTRKVINCAITCVYCLPSVVLIVIGILAWANPVSIFAYVNHDLFLAIYITAFVLSIITMIFLIFLKVKFDYTFTGIFFKYFKHRVVINCFLAVIFFVFGLLTIFNPINRNITIDDKKDFNILVNHKRANEFNYKLENDFDFENECVDFFEQLGSSYFPYEGVFDGNYHVIKNVKAKGAHGFIAQNKGVIKNLTLENISITRLMPQGQYSTSRPGYYKFYGILTSKNSGEINNCMVINSSFDGRDSYAQSVGGLVGLNLGTLKFVTFINPFEKHLFDGNSYNSLSGLVGSNDGVVNNALIISDISGAHSYRSSDCKNIIAFSSPMGIDKNSFEYSLLEDVKKNGVYIFYNDLVEKNDMPVFFWNWSYDEKLKMNTPCFGFEGISPFDQKIHIVNSRENIAGTCDKDSIVTCLLCDDDLYKMNAAYFHMFKNDSCINCGVSAFPYKMKGKTIIFGEYPQSQVLDKSLITTLTMKAGNLPSKDAFYNWSNFEYYNGDSNENYMWYIDVLENGERYRGVYFTDYRHYDADSISYSYKENVSYQDENNYKTNNIYWFKYEPITWTIIDEDFEDATLILLCDMILDFQPYGTTLRKSEVDGKNVYPNNYSFSMIRKWLNDDFINTAFFDYQRQIIIDTTIKNDVSESQLIKNGYLKDVSKNKIFLISEEYIVNPRNGFLESDGKDSQRQKESTDYAKVQGGYVDNSTHKSNWWLSGYADYSYTQIQCSTTTGYLSSNEISRLLGVVPALRLTLE